MHRFLDLMSMISNGIAMKFNRYGSVNGSRILQSNFSYRYTTRNLHSVSRVYRIMQSHSVTIDEQK